MALVCEEDDWLAVEAEGAGTDLDVGGADCVVVDVDGMVGGGGRPGVDLIGGGRRGRSFALEGLGGRGGSEEFVFVVSGLFWVTGPLLRAGAGVVVGGLRPTAGPEGFGAVAGAAAAGLGGTGFGSGAVGDVAVGLGARFGALDLRREVRAAGFVGMPGRELPTFTV